MAADPPHVAELEAFLTERGEPLLRAAIVLRYLEDLSDTESAQVMGCSVATVRSAISRGLGRLRELDDEYDPVSRRKA